MTPDYPNLETYVAGPDPVIRGRPDMCGRTDIVTTVEGRELLFRCDRERDHKSRHHAVNVAGVELFWERSSRPETWVGPELRNRSGVVIVWIAAILLVVVSVLAITAAASQSAPDARPAQSGAPLAAVGPAAAPLSGSGPVKGSIPNDGEDSGGAPLTSGEASWYDHGKGLYGAVHSWRFGDDPYWVEVCRQDASATCVLVLVRDYMRHPTRAIDLSPDAFVRLWPGLSRSVALDRGVVDVTVRRTGAVATLPPTETKP